MNYLHKILIVFLAFSLGNCINKVPENTENSTNNETNTETNEVEDFNANILRLVNQYRTAGCNCGSNSYPATKPLKWNDTLENAATIHTKDMYNNNFFSHTGSDGSNVGTRLKRLHYNYSACAENIANGYTTEEAVVKGWIESPGHCKNIMNPKYTHVGCVRKGNYWTMVLARH